MQKLQPLFLLLVLGALLHGCGTTPEAQPQATAAANPPAAEPPAAVEAVAPPAPAPVAEPAPAPAPMPVAQSRPLPPKPQPAPKRVKATPVQTQAPAPTPPPAAAPSEQEIAAAAGAAEEALKRFVLEQARFTTPAAMQVGVPAAAALQFERGAALDELIAALAADPRLAKAQVRVTARVEAQLRGDNIQARASAPAVQEVTAAAPARWQWELQATAPGTQQLHLTIGVETVVAGTAAVRSIHTFDKPVEVAPAAEVGGGFPWWWILVLALAAIVGAWLVKRRKG